MNQNIKVGVCVYTDKLASLSLKEAKREEKVSFETIRLANSDAKQ